MLTEDGINKNFASKILLLHKNINCINYGKNNDKSICTKRHSN